MFDVLKIVCMILCAIVIIVGLLQKGMGDGFITALTGSKDLALFAVQKERGIDKALSITMFVCGMLAVACLLGMQYLMNK